MVLASLQRTTSPLDWECGPSRSSARALAVFQAQVWTGRGVHFSHLHGKAVVTRLMLRLVTEATIDDERADAECRKTTATTTRRPRWAM